MITPDSRYVDADELFTTSHSYNTIGHVDVDLHAKVIVHNRDTLYLLVTDISPNLPPTLKIVYSQDYIGNLAYEALQDPTQWWVVADANPEQRYPLDLKIGSTIRMPSGRLFSTRPLARWVPAYWSTRSSSRAKPCRWRR